MRRRWHARGALCSAALAVLSATASADPTERELKRARELFETGIGLEMAGDWAAALTKFESVAEVSSTPTVRFHIARCKERLGRWTEALGAYRIAVADAQAKGNDELVGVAGAALASLERRIPRLTIVSAADGEAVSVAIDGVSVGGAALGEPLLVDPGAHLLELVWVGRPPRRLTITVREGEQASVRVPEPPPPASAPSPAPVGESARPLGSAAPAPRAAADDRPSAAHPSWLPWAALGVGAAGLGAAAAFYAMREGELADFDRACPSSPCPSSARPPYDRARTDTIAAVAALAIGGIGVGTGTVLLLVAPGEGSQARLVPQGVAWAGRF